MADFSFKDFVVQQQNSPLKVNTDAILLGTTVANIAEQAKVLDVGTGNGVIALLLAARFKTVLITGIDPHVGAFEDASTNFSRSKYAAQLKAICCAISELPVADKYDVIVSNPPYFIDSLLAQKHLDQQAKHLTEAAYFDLLKCVIARLSSAGQVWLILPPRVAQQTQLFFGAHGFDTSLKVKCHANLNKLDKRWILCFEKQVRTCINKSIYIRNLDGTFHSDYLTLAGKFHDRPL